MATDIRIKYSIDTEDIAKATVEFDKLTTEEQDALTALKKYNEELGDTGDEATKSGKKLKDTFKGAEGAAKGAGGSLNSLSGIVSKFGPLVAGAFSVGAIVSFGQQALAVAGKFQGLEAVLKNTLGSDSAAYGAMIRIQEIASSTPFSVEELTQSFVKLANQGFTPTNAQIIAMGNLASSTGKSFDQLAEAIIDAQTGEFERLKEFGIRASKQGDLVKFTFKGVETTVRNTNDAIRQYVTSLGDAAGVSGAMAGQSKTLDGQISNLGDTWDSLLLAIGNGLAPVYEKAIQVTSAFLGALRDLFQSEDQKLKEYEGKQYNAYANFFVKTSDEALKNVEENSYRKLEALKADTERLKAEYGKQQIELSKAQAKSQDEKGSGFARQFQLQADAAKKAYDEAAKLEKATKAMNQAAIDELKKRADARKAAEAQAEKDAAAAAEKANKQNLKDYQFAVKQLEIEKQITNEKIKQTVPKADQATALKEAEMAANLELLKIADQYAAKGVQDAKDKAKLLPEIIKTQNKEISDQYFKDGVKQRQDRVNQEIKTAEDLYKTNLAGIDKTQKIEADVLASLGLNDEELKKKLIQNQILFNEDRIAENNRAANDGVAAAIDANDALIAENKKLNSQLIEDDLQAAEKKREIMLATVDLAGQLTNQSLSLYQAQLDAELSAANKKFDAEVRLADGNKQKLAEIDQRRAEKEKEIKTKQFRANQVQAVANVIFQTAPMIAQYLAGVVTAPLAAIGLAAQAAQIGFILAQPVPAYAEGTKGKRHKGGRAMVGEKGVERIVTESGEVYYTPPTATLLDLPKGAQVIPNHLISKQEIAYASMSRGGRAGSSVDIGGKLTEIGGILKGLPIHQINMDEKGFEKFIRTPNRTAKILNNRFGINS